MKHFTPKFYGALIFAGVTALLLTTLSTTNNAHASLPPVYGTIPAQHVCHDGANRGATTTIWLSIRNHKGGRGNPAEYFWVSKPKGYYTRTECLDLNSVPVYVIRPGAIIYAWFAESYNPSVCPDFKIRYRKNRHVVWVQTGGTTIWNINCKAKHTLGNSNKPDIR